MTRAALNLATLFALAFVSTCGFARHTPRATIRRVVASPTPTAQPVVTSVPAVSAGPTPQVATASFQGRRPALATRTTSWPCVSSWFRSPRNVAAHRTLPFGTRVRVTYAGRSVLVLIGDRGPLARTGRCLDLDDDAFAQLAPLSRGLINVELSIVP